MLKFIKDASGYSATTSQGNTVRVERHCERDEWTVNVYDADYAELDGYYGTAKTKRELVADANNWEV